MLRMYDWIRNGHERIQLSRRKEERSARKQNYPLEELSFAREDIVSKYRNLCTYSWGSTQSSTLSLYEGLVLSRFLYAPPLLLLALSQWEALDALYRMALRVCLGAPWYAANAVIRRTPNNFFYTSFSTVLALQCASFKVCLTVPTVR